MLCVVDGIMHLCNKEQNQVFKKTHKSSVIYLNLHRTPPNLDQYFYTNKNVVVCCLLDLNIYRQIISPQFYKAGNWWLKQIHNILFQNPEFPRVNPI